MRVALMQIWINGKGQLNHEYDIELAMVSIHSLHFSSSSACSLDLWILVPRSLRAPHTKKFLASRSSKSGEGLAGDPMGSRRKISARRFVAR